MRRMIGIALLILTLSSCLVGPNYNRPCLDIPQNYMYEFVEGQITSNTLWWEQFEDSVLDALIVEALGYNNDIRIAAANIEQALGQLIETRAQLYPQFGYSGSYTRERLSENIPQGAFGPNPQTILQLLANVSWEIDLFGRLRRLTEAARADFFATIEARRGIILTITGTVAKAYLTLRGLDEQLSIAKETLDSYAQSLHYFELQYEYGQVSKINVVQAQTQYELAAASIPQIELQIVQVENALSVLLGRNPSNIPRGKSIYELKLPEVPSGIPSEILENRPDVLQAEQNLVAANALIGAAKALYFPSISLTGAYGAASSSLQNLFSGPSRTWSYMGNFIGPIFTFGRISGQVQQAVAGREAALYNYINVIQRAFAEVENALAARIMLTEQLKAEERLVKASGEYVYFSKLQFNEGYSPYFVVLQAQEQFFPAELSLVQTRVELFSSLVDIYQAMGGGWVLTAESLTCP
ncbi:MAG: multidrug efflux RND transporter outer membrane channel subunit OprM [Chlamydiales bacterium]